MPESRETIVAALSGALANIDTTHSVSNPFVSVNGEKAHLEAIVEAQHVTKNDPTRHNLHNADLAKQAGEWLIQRVTVDNVWRTGDPTVLAGV